MAAKIVVTPDPPKRQAIGELHKKATALLSDGHVEQAIELLRQAHQLMRKEAFCGDAVDKWLRLPLVLQKAGRFDEAMREFEALLSDLYAIKLKQLPQYPDEIVMLLTHRIRAVIYDRMRLACKREKRLDLAQRYADLAEEELRKADEADKLVEAWEKERRAAFRKARSDRRLMDAFYKKYPQSYR